jgi:Protein of unknown function (DUF2971)
MRFLDQILMREPSNLLYHYTNQAGLLGIVTNKCIWATSAHYQNDAKELSHALDLSKGVIATLRDASRAPEEERLLRAMNRTLDAVKAVNIFVCSFSVHKDMLSQWRGYCSGGNGFSIGFDSEKIKAAMIRQGLRLVPCIYKPPEHNQLVSELVNETVESFREDLERSVPLKHALRSRPLEYRNRLFSLAPIIKHDTFAEEGEWRAVSNPTARNHPNVAYRAGTSMLTPYLVIKLADNHRSLPIREIVVGPTPHMDLASDSVVHFLLSSGVEEGLAVYNSRIPFRQW